MTFGKDERKLLESVAAIAFLNPFEEERLEIEAQVLGRRARRAGTGGVSLRDSAAWESLVDDLVTRLLQVLERHRAAVLDEPARLSDEDARLWLDAVRFAVFHRFRAENDALILAAKTDAGRARSVVRQMREMFLRYLPAAPPGMRRRAEAQRADDSLTGSLLAAPYIDPEEADRLVAILFQMRRAFLMIFSRLVGSSPAMGRLRAAVWEAALTRDLRLYATTLLGRMRDFSVLILGESGTGKELVARAIGLSQFIPWDEKKGDYAQDFRTQFLGCNIAQFAETLLESELFGYVKGAFTGATRDAEGMLAVCPPGGVVFLDEVGDLAPAVQVKLLRVMQERQFSPVGSRETLPFHGRLISATNRDIREQVEAGELREDFVFRLASTTIRLPPLRQRLAEAPDELDELLGYIVASILGRTTDGWPDENDPFCQRVVERVRDPLARLTAAGYAWPGNVRELEQAVRAILMHGAYEPLFDAAARGAGGGASALHEAVEAGRLSMNDLRDAYCQHAYDLTGSYQAAGDRIGVDWRTVKSAVNRRTDAESGG